MRKSVGIVLALISVLLLGATVVSFVNYKKSAAQFAEATASEANMRLRYDRAVSEIVTIQDSLNVIVLGPDASRFVSAAPLDESQPPGTLHDAVLSRIASLKASIERTKERIEELDARLKKNGVQIVGLEKMIARLRGAVSEKEARIAELSTQVDTLSTRVAGLSVQVDNQQLELTVKQDELTSKQRELATIFYAMGTKKELTSSGVVESKGGVLGIGKTLEPTGYFDEAAFVSLDTDQENVIRIPAERAQVLSAQPLASYVLEPIGKEMYELRILDAVQFRKVKHLVILKA
jgi:predicted RNase H-like nuclease (RuvC/YqgF family)